MITDFQGNFLDVNPGFCAMFGYTYSELLKMNINVLIDPEQLKLKPIQFKQLEEGKQVFKQGGMIW